MQTASVKLLPVDPAPANDRRDEVDRGFADYLRGERPAAKTDSQPPRETTARRDATRTEKPATPDDRSGDGTGKADRAAPETAGRVEKKTRPDADADDAAAEPGHPDSTVAETAVSTPAAATPTQPGLPMPQMPAPSADGEVAATVTSVEPVSGATTAGTQPIAADAPAAAPAAAGQDAATDGTPEGLPVEPVAAKTTQAPVTAAPPSNAEQATAPAAPEPAAAPGTIPAAASAAVAAAVPAATGTTRNAAGTTTAGVPATPGAASDGGAAATGAAQPGDEAAAAVKPAENGQAQNRAGTGGAQAAVAAQPSATAPPTDQTARAAMPDPSTAGTEAAPRTAEAPATGQAPHHAQTGAPSTTFANELRLASGATPSPDTPAARPAPVPPVSQMAVQISRAVSEGQDKLTIDLKPAALGRVSVSLELGHDHRVIAVISADRSDTLDLLQRDARSLERALQDAGLKTDSGSLSFSLNGDGAKESPADEGDLPGQFIAAQAADEAADAPPPPYDPYSSAVNLTGIDIHI